MVCGVLAFWFGYSEVVVVFAPNPYALLVGVVSGGVCRLLVSGVAARVVVSFSAISLQRLAAGAGKCHGFAVVAMVSWGKLSNSKHYGCPLIEFIWINGYASMGCTIPYPYPLYLKCMIFSRLQTHVQYFVPHPYFYWVFTRRVRRSWVPITIHTFKQLYINRIRYY
jgi:hypothetical protein